MTACASHPFGDPKGLDCIRTDVHSTGHVYHSAWLADVHTQEVSDD